MFSDYSVPLTLYKVGEISFHLVASNGFHVKAELYGLLLLDRVAVKTSNLKISCRRLTDYIKEFKKLRRQLQGKRHIKIEL